MAGSTVEIISLSIKQNNPTAIQETFELDFTSTIGICGYVYIHNYGLILEIELNVYWWQQIIYRIIYISKSVIVIFFILCLSF